MTFARDLMTKNIITMDAGKKAYDAANLMTEKNISTLILVKNDEPVGIVTERDFLRRVSAKDLKTSEIVLEQIMSSPLVTVQPNAPIEMAAAIMAEKRIRRLVVVQDKKVVGILTSTDLIKDLQEGWIEVP